MTLDPVSFARGCASRGPCAQFVGQWLAAQGVSGTPSSQAILRDWRALGVEPGVELWCERLGLVACAPRPFAIALARQPQDAAPPLLGILSATDLFVARSFGKVLIARNVEIVRAWRV